MNVIQDSDRLSLSGRLEITLDEAGYAAAKQLADTLYELMYRFDVRQIGGDPAFPEESIAAVPVPIEAPFQNESETTAIGGLTIENRLDRISVYGNTEIRADAEGYRQVNQLTRLLMAAIGYLAERREAGMLPEQVGIEAPIRVIDPFH